MSAIRVSRSRSLPLGGRAEGPRGTTSAIRASRSRSLPLGETGRRPKGVR